MIPYNELNESTRKQVLAEAAKLTVSHFAESPGAKPREVAYVAFRMMGAGKSPRFVWDADVQTRYIIAGADWARPYAVSAGVSRMPHAVMNSPDPSNKKLRREFDTVEVPMSDIIEYIQELCRRATGEVV